MPVDNSDYLHPDGHNCPEIERWSRRGSNPGLAAVPTWGFRRAIEPSRPLEKTFPNRFTPGPTSRLIHSEGENKQIGDRT